jgi:hypothetical protein
VVLGYAILFVNVEFRQQERTTVCSGAVYHGVYLSAGQFV